MAFKHGFLLSKAMSTQMAIVSSNGIFANSDWMSKDATKRFGFWSRISLENEKESLTVYSLIVNYFNIGTKKFLRL